MSRKSLFAALAALERARGGRIGGTLDREPLRFVPSTGLGFAARDAEVGADPRELVTHLHGLVGADGALPPHLIEEVAREDPDRPVRRALLTPFHHRATALLYRSVQRCRIPEETRSLDDAWPTRLGQLGRVDATADALAREVALVLAPLLRGPPSASAMVQALGVIGRRWLDGVRVELAQHTGGRAPIAPTRLGRARLGDTAVLGSSVHDPSSRATITIGPLPAGTRAIAPDAPALRALALVVGWLGDAATEVEVVALFEEPRLRVGRACLGRSALGARSAPRRTRCLDLAG